MKTKICVTFIDNDGRLDCATVEVDTSKKIGRHMAETMLDAVIRQIPENQGVLNILVGRA